MTELWGGRYELEAKLGQGAMGTVWRALDRRTQRKVALKEMRGSGVDAERQLRREMLALARLRHPNVVDVLDAGSTTDRRHYLAMDLVEGITLKAELARVGRLPWDRARHIAVQIAKGLVAAHAEGVVHRDLKPANVVLSELYGEADVVKIVDFGLAQLTDATQSSRTGVGFAGTPVYASPEQARGAPSTAASDLYSLGVILYEMLVGEPPFEAATPMGMLFHHVHTLPVPPSRRGVALTAELEGLVVQLLHKRVAERPPSAREIVVRLEKLDEERRDVAALDGRAPQTAGTDFGSTLHSPTLPPLRRRVARGGALILLGGLGAGAVGLRLEPAREGPTTSSSSAVAPLSPVPSSPRPSENPVTSGPAPARQSAPSPPPAERAYRSEPPQAVAHRAAPRPPAPPRAIPPPPASPRPPAAPRAIPPPPASPETETPEVPSGRAQPPQPPPRRYPWLTSKRLHGRTASPPPTTTPSEALPEVAP